MSRVSSADTHTEFADPPPAPSTPLLPSVSSPVIPQDPEPVVPTDNPPTTLMQWAVLILNTANPTLKVHYLPPHSSNYGVHNRYQRFNAPERQLTSSELGNSRQLDTRHLTHLARLMFPLARRHSRGIWLIQGRSKTAKIELSCYMLWPI
jgi:hypothetical protein